MAADKGAEKSSGVSQPPGVSATGTLQPVFVSYASADAKIANQVCQTLEAQGVLCWIAPRDVKPGAQYADAIVRAINDAKALVLVLSGAATASEHVSREVERAGSKHKQIIALKIDAAALSAELEYFLSRSQWIDVPVLGMPAALARLTEAVGQGAGSSSVSPGLGDGGAFGGPAANRAVGTANVAKRVVVAAAVVLVVGIALTLAVRFWPTKHPEAQAPTVAANPDKSIAVLPFADMSEKKDQEYFADGMAEEILDLLAKIPKIKVIGRTSSFQFKNKNEDLRTIGKLLGAAYVVEGSVRKSGNTIRITAQLIEAQSGTHRWSETYERDIGDVLKLQDETAAGIARALEVTIGATDLQPSLISPKPEAYDVYLHGKHAFDRSDEDGFAEAADDFQQALDLDPTFADAAAWLAITKMLQAEWGYLPPKTAFEQGQRAAETALRINPNQALAHVALGNKHVVYDWDWEGAENELKRALALQPHFFGALYVSSELAATRGRWDDAVRLMNDSLTLDPLYPSGQFFLGAIRWRSDHLAEAETAIRRGLQISPGYASGHMCLALVLVTRGKVNDALSEVQLETDEITHLIALAIVNAAVGHRPESDSALGTLTSKFADIAAFNIAEIRAFRAEPEKAFEWLDRAYAQKDSALYTIKGDPLLKSLEADPRYKAFLRKMNLSE